MAYIMNKVPLNGFKEDGVTPQGPFSAIQSWSSNTLPENYAWFPASLMNEFYKPGLKCAGFVIPTYDESGENVVSLTQNIEGYEAWLATLPPWYQKGIPNKISELSKECNTRIEAGVDVELEPAVEANEEEGIKAKDAVIEHFDLKSEDQANISNAFMACLMGATEYPYHSKDNNCRVYTAKEFTTIYVTTQTYITSLNTKFNQLKQMVQSYEGQTDKESECMAITFDTELTGEYLTTYNSMMQTANDQIQAIVAKLSSTLNL